MAYNADLAERVRLEIIDREGLTERNVFGGRGFLIDGNMACGVIGNDVLLRPGPEALNQALALPYCAQFEGNGRVMTGWVRMLPAGHDDDAILREWVRRSADYTATLPPKSAKR
jgi:TfoX/Sxy family transcriptional regulator of competence genes